MSGNNPVPPTENGESPQRRRARIVGAGWRLAFRSRRGQARGFLRFWPIWEWLTLRVMPHRSIPNAPYHLLEVQFTHVDAKPITLPDGTQIRRRDPVAIVHVNNAVLSQIGDDLTPWQLLRMMRGDMRALAQWVKAGGFPRDVRALYGYTLLGRAASRLGFTLRSRPSSIRTRLDRFFLMGIMVLYHTSGRGRLQRGTTYDTEPVETWMSLTELVRRFGGQQTATAE